jgi:hypothetical protein
MCRLALCTSILPGATLRVSAPAATDSVPVIFDAFDPVQ